MNKGPHLSMKGLVCLASSLAVMLSFLACAPANAFVNALRGVYELAPTVIKSLATLGKAKGAGAVARELEIAAKGLSPSQLKYFYEANYLKILVEQKKLSPMQMNEYFTNLKDVKGFRETLSKMVGKDTGLGINANAKGHGFELEAANSLVKSRFNVLSLGKEFDDGIKLAKTDIDIIAENGGKKFAFELKNYGKTFFKLEERAKFFDDIKSLGAYMRQNKNTQGIFLMRNSPDVDTANHLIALGKSEGVIVGFGEPSAFINTFMGFLK